MATGHQGEASLSYRYPRMQLLADEELQILKGQAGPSATIAPSYLFDQDGTGRLVRPLIFKCNKCGSAHTIDSCPTCRADDFGRGLVQTKPPYARRGVFCASCGLGASDFVCQTCSEVVPFVSSFHTLRLPISQSGSCFIATAAFGTASAPQVEILREFGDDRLLKSGLGDRFIQFYYRHSPLVAAVIEPSRPLRWAVRACFLGPLARASFLWRMFH